MSTVQIILEGIDDATNVIGNVEGALGGLASLASGALTAGFAAATAAGGALVAGLGIAIHEAMDAQETMADLNSTLRATGRENLKQPILDMADALKDLAGGSDDAVISAANMLAGFQNIGDKIMPDATKATLDLAAKLNIGADAAADMLGPILATGDRLNALKKANITFTDSEEKKIKQLFASGKAAEAQQIILAKLNDTIGGTAADHAQTFSGQIEIMKNHLLDAAEGIGTKLLPVMTDLFEQVVKPSIPLIEEFAGSIGNIITLLTTGDFSGGIFGLQEDDPFINALFVARDAIQGVVDVLVLGKEPLGDWSTLWEALSSVFGGDVATQLMDLLSALENLQSAFAEQMPAMQASGEAFIAWLQDAFGDIGPQILTNLTTAVNALAEIWRQHGDEIMEIVRIAFEFIIATIGGALTLLSGIVASTLQLLSGDWEGALRTMQETLTAFMEMALSIAGTNLEAFVATWKGDWELLQTIVSTVTMNMTAGIQTWLITTINAVKERFADFKKIGEDLMENVRLGIAQKVAQIISDVERAVKDAISAAGRALGGASPFGGGNSGGGSNSVPGFAAGGVAQMPVSGGLAVLHGTEAVIPLQGGSVPVQIQGGVGGGSQPIIVQLVTSAGDLLATVRGEANAQGWDFAQVA